MHKHFFYNKRFENSRILIDFSPLFTILYPHMVCILDQLLGACQLCIIIGSWVPLCIHGYLITIAGIILALIFLQSFLKTQIQSDSWN